MDNDIPKIVRVLNCRVVDGDTCALDLDLLFNVRFSVNTRFLGIDAPEKSTAAGKLVKQVVEKWVNTSGPLIWESTTIDKYGRSLGDLLTRKDKVSLNQYLLANKLAHAYNGSGKRVWTTEEYDAAITSAKTILGIS